LAGAAPKKNIYELGGAPIDFEQLAEIVGGIIGRKVQTNPIIRIFQLCNSSQYTGHLKLCRIL